MSGSFENLDVPPTLVSFAVSTTRTDRVVSTEFKHAGNKVYIITPCFDENKVPQFDSVREVFGTVEKLIAEGKVASAWTIGYGGVCEGITKMCLGNRLGFDFSATFDDAALFEPLCGGFILESAEDLPNLPCIGTVSPDYLIHYGFDRIDLNDIQENYNSYSLICSKPLKNRYRNIPSLFRIECRQRQKSQRRGC